MPRKRLIVVGGGIVGLATAYRLGQKFPDAGITVLEKEPAVGRHQSGNNSGVLHAGLYYKPGSAKALLAVNGIRQMIAFCQQHQIPHEICGKLVVATAEEELPRLHDLLDRGRRNGLAGLQLLNADQMREVEPHVAGIAAIRVPEEGIVDYPRVCQVLATQIHGQVITNARVRALRQTPGGWVALTNAGDYECDFLINCAGLHCDRVSQMAGILKPGGTAVVLAPQGQGLYGSLDEAMGHKRRFSSTDLRGMMEQAGLRVDRVYQMNKIGTVSWFIFGKVLGRKRINKFSLKVFDKTVWIWRRIDGLLPWKGLSVIAVATKNPTKDQ